MTTPSTTVAFSGCSCAIHASYVLRRRGGGECLFFFLRNFLRSFAIWARLRLGVVPWLVERLLVVDVGRFQSRALFGGAVERAAEAAGDVHALPMRSPRQRVGASRCTLCSNGRASPASSFAAAVLHRWRQGCGRLYLHALMLAETVIYAARQEPSKFGLLGSSVLCASLEPARVTAAGRNTGRTQAE